MLKNYTSFIRGWRNPMSKYFELGKIDEEKEVLEFYFMADIEMIQWAKGAYYMHRKWGNMEATRNAFKTIVENCPKYGFL